MGIITLTTDFGTEDAYVASMKGVALGINPDAILIDISHQIAPQDIAEAAFVLATAYPSFPDHTVHVVVVDPGVGTTRRAIILKSPKATFVAPDNGVLGYVVGTSYAEDYPGITKLVEPPSGWTAHAVTNDRYWRHPINTTFHGRDIFAPVAAHLSLGIPPDAFGEAISSLYALPVPIPVSSAGEIRGHVIHIDHFGNVITSLKPQDFPAGQWLLQISGYHIRSLSLSYEEIVGLGALAGSSGYVEIAASSGNAAMETGLKVGDKIAVQRGADQ